MHLKQDILIVYIFTSIWECVVETRYTEYTYIYIYIEREREGGRGETERDEYKISLILH